MATAVRLGVICFSTEEEEGDTGWWFTLTHGVHWKWVRGRLGVRGLPKMSKEKWEQVSILPRCTLTEAVAFALGYEISRKGDSLTE